VCVCVCAYVCLYVYVCTYIAHARKRTTACKTTAAFSLSKSGKLNKLEVTMEDPCSINTVKI